MAAKKTKKEEAPVEETKAQETKAPAKKPAPKKSTVTVEVTATQIHDGKRLRARGERLELTPKQLKAVERYVQRVD